MKHNVIEMGAILARLVGLMAGALISIKLIFFFFFAQGCLSYDVTAATSMYGGHIGFRCSLN